MALRRRDDRRRGRTWTEPAPEQESAEHDASCEEDGFAEARGDAFAGLVRDVAESVRNLAYDLGEAIRQGLGDVPGDLELGRKLVEQIAGLSHLEALAPELVILGIDLVDLAGLGDLVHVLHDLGPALLERVEAVLGGQAAAALLELLPGVVPVRCQLDDLGVERARNLHRPASAAGER